MPNGWFNGEREYYATAAMGPLGDAPSTIATAPDGDILTEFERDLCRKTGVDPDDFIKTKSARSAGTM